MKGIDCVASCYIYVIKSAKAGMYVGHAEDLDARIKQHNAGMNIATKMASDWKLIYSEKLDSRGLAMKREKFLKSGDGRRVLISKGVI